jgi:hypothetical protein
VNLRRQLAIVALVYVIEGFPMGVFQRVLSVYFRRHDGSLAEIGMLSALAFAWTAKPLWSPLVERFGARQDWIRAALLAMMATLAAVAFLPVNPIGRPRSRSLSPASPLPPRTSRSAATRSDWSTAGEGPQTRCGLSRRARALEATSYDARWLGWHTRFSSRPAHGTLRSLGFTPPSRCRRRTNDRCTRWRGSCVRAWFP